MRFYRGEKGGALLSVSFEKQSGIQVIRRAATILRVIRDAPDGMSLGQIALKIGLPRSTVQRIVRALQNEGMIAWSTVNGGIVLGPEMQNLGAASRYDIVTDCRIILQEIGEATGETVDLTVLREDGMILLDQVPGTHRLRTVTPIGEIFPLTTTANGRASLALLEPALLQDLLERSGAMRSDAALSSFTRSLKDVRRTHLAYDLDDHTDGIHAIGIAFRDLHGDIYSISVPIPRSRFDAQRAQVERSLLAARDTVERLQNSDIKEA